jgi:hypothetical protein
VRRPRVTLVVLCAFALTAAAFGGHARHRHATVTLNPIVRENMKQGTPGWLGPIVRDRGAEVYASATDATVLFHRELGGDKNGNADATRYVAPSGAIVFASGSHQFSWGLTDITYDPFMGHGFESKGLQRFVLNAFDAMTGKARASVSRKTR